MVTTADLIAGVLLRGGDPQGDTEEKMMLSWRQRFDRYIYISRNTKDLGKAPEVRRKRKKSEVTQSCPTLWDPMDYSLAGSSVPGMFQARILEWVAISFFRRSFQPWD